MTRRIVKVEEAKCNTHVVAVAWGMEQGSRNDVEGETRSCVPQ